MMGTNKHQNMKKITERTMGVFSTSAQEAIKHAKQLGYPVLVSSSYSLGVSFNVIDEKKLWSILQRAFDASPIHQVLVQRMRTASGRSKRAWRLNEESG